MSLDKKSYIARPFPHFKKACRPYLTHVPNMWSCFSKHILTSIKRISKTLFSLFSVVWMAPLLHDIPVCVCSCISYMVCVGLVHGNQCLHFGSYSSHQGPLWILFPVCSQLVLPPGGYIRFPSLLSLHISSHNPQVQERRYSRRSRN